MNSVAGSWYPNRGYRIPIKMVSNSTKVVFLFLSLCAVNYAYQIKPRIVNGDAATKGQFPYYAHIAVAKVNSTRLICGGALITPEFVLTAVSLANTSSI